MRFSSKSRSASAGLGAAMLLTLLGGPTSAGAVPSKVPPSLTSAEVVCNEALVREGECLFAAVKEGEDPVVAGVANALKQGYYPSSSIEKFVETRGKHVQDASQSSAESLLQKNKASRNSDGSTPVAMMNPGGVGTVSGRSLYVTDVVSIYVCPSSGDACVVQSKVDVEWRYSLWYGSTQESILSADFDVQGSYPAPFFNNISCTTVHDGLFNIDEVVQDWRNCSIHSDPFRTQSYVQIQALTWSGGDRGEIYHPQYDLSMELTTSYGWSGPLQLGWTGLEYEIKSDGTTVWREA